MVVLTLFRGLFLVPAAKADTHRKAYAYEAAVAKARGERTRVITHQAWFKECEEADRVWHVNKAKARAT